MTLDELKGLIAKGETLQVEFKSDQKDGLRDTELVEALVAMANSVGGILLEGVEDDGRVTGLHSKHFDLGGVGALVENRTTPGLIIEAERVDCGGGIFVGVLRVRKSKQVTATSDGKFLRRRLDAHGKPEVVAIKPADIMSLQSTLGLYDPSALIFEGVEMEELDPLQHIRLRKVIEAYSEERALLKLTDVELDKALGFCEELNGWHPTLTGLLLLGTEDLLRRHVPSYEVAFQVLKTGKVKVNIHRRKPLLEVFEEFSILFDGQYTEEEMEIGLFRKAIPNFDKTAFREAFVNALVHRDYNILGTVSIQFDDLGLTITSPGGFIEGVTLENLLDAPPKSRNPCLADAIKRIGLAERTGRGVDRIYGGLLRYGRPAPDYSETTSAFVRVRMLEGRAGALFIRLLMKCEDRGINMPIDSLLVLSILRNSEQTIQELATRIRKSEAVVHALVGALLREEIIEQKVVGRMHVYYLGKAYHQALGREVDYTKTHGLSFERMVNMICEHLDQYKRITCGQVRSLCGVNRAEAKKLIVETRGRVNVRLVGHGRGAFYELEGGEAK